MMGVYDLRNIIVFKIRGNIFKKNIVKLFLIRHSFIHLIIEENE